MHRDELKPCPYCGGRVSLKASESGGLVSIICDEQSTCRNTGLYTCTQADKIETAIEQYNTRAALSEQTLPVRVEVLCASDIERAFNEGWDDCRHADRHDRNDEGRLAAWHASYSSAIVDVPAVEREPVAWLVRDNADDEFRIEEHEPEICWEKRALFAHPPRSALVDNSHASEAVVERWQPIETAPKDGKHCILSVQEGAFIYSVQGAFDGKQWNAVHRDGVEPLCWMPNSRVPSEFLPASFRSSGPAEVGSATTSSGTGGGE